MASDGVGRLGLYHLCMSDGRKDQPSTSSTPRAEMNVQPRANTAAVNVRSELVPLCTYCGASSFVVP